MIPEPHKAFKQLISPLASDQGGFCDHFAAQNITNSARYNIARAKNWINICLQEHAECKRFQENTVSSEERPTRVIEILGDSSVVLRCNMSKEHYDYLALSHMWGTNHKDQIRLIEKRLAEFQRSIPWQELPYIYLEAIYITRQLGYRYLWIDSLCIVQDSNDDWTHEARRMAIVYGNCVCNVAYLFPPGTSPPPRDDPRLWNPCIVRSATPEQPGVYIRHLVDTWRQAFPDEHQDWLVQRHWPLFLRAWTFQEYLLSPRTLLYGHKNLMFQCSRLFYDEMLGPIASTNNATSAQQGRDLSKTRYFSFMLPKLSIDGTTELSSQASLRFMLDYTSLVAEYRARILSFHTDRIMAFAGIASAFQSLSSLAYLAGLWWEYLPLQLLWFVEQKPAALVRGQYPETFKRGDEVKYTSDVVEVEVDEAPSWSWFAAPIYKFFRVGFLFNDDEPAARKRSIQMPEKAGWEDIYVAKPTCYRFDGFAPNKHPGHDAFDKFAGLQLTLNTLTWPVSKDLPANLASHIYSFDKDAQWDPSLKYHPDRPADSLSPPRHGVFALLFEFQITRASHVQRRLAGLLLVPASDKAASAVWKRAGVWYLKLQIRGVDGSAEDLGLKWKGLCLTRDWIDREVTIT